MAPDRRSAVATGAYVVLEPGPRTVFYKLITSVLVMAAVAVPQQPASMVPPVGEPSTALEADIDPPAHETKIIQKYTDAARDVAAAYRWRYPPKRARRKPTL